MSNHVRSSTYTAIVKYYYSGTICMLSAIANDSSAIIFEIEKNIILIWSPL